MNADKGASFTRRGVIGLGASVATTAFLAACTAGGGGNGGSGEYTGEPLKFWNMPWGTPAFNKLDKKITLGYEPKKTLPSVKYQNVPWSGAVQAFSTAIASGTGPAVSSGTGTQAFLFAAQDKIAYADDLLDEWKSNGIYDDFLPGLVDVMKAPGGYAAIPYTVDIRVFWYNKVLLEKAGAGVPTDWQSYMDACAALKKIGVYGYGSGSGAGNASGNQSLVSFMVNNGGGLFDEDQQPNCVTDKNIEAMEFILELVRKGYSDPGCASYTNDNVNAQWAARNYGMGWGIPGLAVGVGGAVANEMALGDPITSPNGTKGTLLLLGNVMMYKDTPSQKGSEAFLTYYYKNMSPLWTESTGAPLPPLKSITETEEFQASPSNVKIIEDWVPVGKSYGAPGGKGLSANVVAVDGSTAVYNFAQTILGGETDAKTALTTLQKEIKANLPKI